MAMPAGPLKLISAALGSLALALALGLPAAAMAQQAGAKVAVTKVADPNEKCLGCHAEPEPTDKSAAGKPVQVLPEQFHKSMHGKAKVACIECHADAAMRKYPHESPAPAQCASCHEKAVKQYAATAHGVARSGGNTVAATCANCHGTHDTLPAADEQSRTNRANIEATCAACHGNEALVKQGKVPGGNIAALYHDSIHGKLLHSNGKAKDKVPVCTDCHGSHDIRPKSDPQSAVSRANIPDTCGTCHSRVKDVWSGGQHGKMRASGVMTAPGCTDCHGAHTIADPKVPKWQVGMIRECGGCHTRQIGTYRDTYHGQVTDLGFTVVATCASCHGAHEMLPKSNPLSKVSDERILSTCQVCHPKANANFVKFQPHANKHDKESGLILYYTSKFMQILLVGVFLAFGLHSILWLYRGLADRKARRARAASTLENP